MINIADEGTSPEQRKNTIVGRSPTILTARPNLIRPVMRLFFTCYFHLLFVVQRVGARAGLDDARPAGHSQKAVKNQTIKAETGSL